METNVDKLKIQWYLRPVAIVIAIIAVGPFAIPLVWMSPALNKRLKIALTIFLVILAVWMFNASATLYETLKADMLRLQDVIK